MAISQFDSIYPLSYVSLLSNDEYLENLNRLESAISYEPLRPISTSDEWMMKIHNAFEEYKNSHLIDDSVTGIMLSLNGFPMKKVLMDDEMRRIVIYESEFKQFQEMDINIIHQGGDKYNIDGCPIIIARPIKEWK